MRNVKAIVVLAMVFVFAGCRGSGPTPAPGGDPYKYEPGYVSTHMNTVNIVDEDLLKSKFPEKKCYIVVEQTTVKRTPTQTLRVTALLRNASKDDLIVECRTHFFDAQQSLVDGPTVWKRQYISPNAVAVYEEVSLKKEAEYFYIEVRGAEQ